MEVNGPQADLDALESRNFRVNGTAWPFSGTICVDQWDVVQPDGNH